MLKVEIRVKGQISEHWSQWFDEMTISYAGDDTVLTGKVVDQAALYGVLARLRDLGLSLLSVQFVEPEEGGEAA